MRPIGVPDEEWSVGYGQTSTVDGLPLVGSWGGGSYTARAAARVGRLMLRDGDWDGTQAPQRRCRPPGHPRRRHAGPLRHRLVEQQRGYYPKLPRDAFWGSGAGHQISWWFPA